MLKSYKKMTSAAIILSMLVAIVTLSACTKTENNLSASNIAVSSATKTVGKTTTNSTAVTKTALSTDAKKTTNMLEKTGKIETGTSDIIDINTDDGESSETVGQDIKNERVTEESLDLGGFTIDFELIYAVRIPAVDNATESRRILWQTSQDLEKKYNCKFNFKADCNNSNTTAINIMRQNALSGTETREVLYVSDRWIIPNLVDSGYFLRVDDYLSKDSYSYEKLVNGLDTWKGHDYGVTETGMSVGAPYNIAYNKEIMDRLGINIWADYVDKENWNWNTFLDVASAATQDFNGDGIIDQWGLKGWTEQYLGMAFVIANDGHFIREDGNTIKYCLADDPKAVKALQFISDLYNVYKVTYLGGSAQKDMYNNKAAMQVIAGGNFSSSFYNDAAQAVKIFIAPIPKGPDSSGYVAGIKTYFDLLAFPKIQGNPDNEIVNIVSELLGERYRKIEVKGDMLRANAESWYLKNPANLELFIKTVELAGKPFVMEHISLFDPLESEITSKILNQIVAQSIPVTTKLQETKNVMQGYIDAMLNK